MISGRIGSYVQITKIFARSTAEKRVSAVAGAVAIAIAVAMAVSRLPRLARHDTANAPLSTMPPSPRTAGPSSPEAPSPSLGLTQRMLQTRLASRLRERRPNSGNNAESGQFRQSLDGATEPADYASEIIASSPLRCSRVCRYMIV